MQLPTHSTLQDALDRLDKSIDRASRQVLFIRTRKSNLLAAPFIEPTAIIFVNHALDRAEQELAELHQAASDLRNEMSREQAA